MIIVSRWQFSYSKAKSKRIALLLGVSWLLTKKVSRKAHQNTIAIVIKNRYMTYVAIASLIINADRKYIQYQ